MKKNFEILSYLGQGTQTIYNLNRETGLYESEDGLKANPKLINNPHAFKIASVENIDGSIFMLNDTVKSITESPFIKGVMKITDFRINKAGDGICAITDRIPVYGIGINRLEHYILRKDEETPLETAKRIYKVGTEIISLFGTRCFIASEAYPMGENIYILDEFHLQRIIYSQEDEKWAEIIK